MPRKEPPHIAQPTPPRPRPRPAVPPPETRSVLLNGVPVAYTLRISARARRIRFVIRPGGELEVVAPRGTRTVAIEEGLRAKAHWILTTSARMAQQAPQQVATPLTPGASLPYLGQRVQLIVQTGAPSGRYRVALALTPTLPLAPAPQSFPAHSSRPMPGAQAENPIDTPIQAHLDFSQQQPDSPTNEAMREEGTLTLTVHTADEATIRAALDAWYRRQARMIIAERLAHWNTQYGFTYRRVAIKEQKTRWGSCSRKGNLNFNWRLLLAPLPILDYVVIHELCHLKEQNHAPRFWALVAQSCPDYRERRRWLRMHGHELHF